MSTIGIELHQLCRIDTIRFDLFSTWAGDAGRSNDITMVAFFNEIPLQGVTNIRRFVT